MTGRTHLAVGVAAALVAAGPEASLATLACAAAGGAVGAVLPDLDVRDTAHPWRERLSRVGAAALLVAALALDAAHGGEMARQAAERGLSAVALGLAILAALACAARLSAHRSFSHSLAALAGFTGATMLACPPLAPSVLDALNHRGLRLLWPLRRTLSLGLCKTGGVADACLLVAALVATALALAGALGW